VAAGVSGNCAETRRLPVGEVDSCNSVVDGASTPSAGRAKRLRTSFKQHQLRVLRSYFALNHNPDAKDLGQLAHKTALGKRILQV